MCENDYDNQFVQESVPSPKKEKEPKTGFNYKMGMALVSLMLVCSLGFSAFQTIYIYKLNTGKTGIYSYQTDNTDSSEETIASNLSSDKEVAQPWFSIEDAASVSDPNKKKLSTVEIANLVSPATVSIYIKGTVNGQKGTISSGSGFIITEDGYVVTNAHVVDDVKGSNYELFVKVPGFEKEIAGKVIGTDKQTDIAVVKLVCDAKLPCVTIGNSETLQAGEMVVAIGNALGTLDGTVTVGVISSVNREISNNGYSLKVLQTDAAINEGNSGGPLINSFGEVIGVTNAKMVTTTSEGLGFAIPITSVRGIIEALINYGVVNNRPFLGISVSTVTNNAYYGAEPGVYIVEYVKNGPGDKAGFKTGDRILTMDGVEITEAGDIIDVRDSHKVGDKVKVEIIRDGAKLTLEMTIGDSADYEENPTVSDEVTPTPAVEENQPEDNNDNKDPNGGLNIFGGTKGEE